MISNKAKLVLTLFAYLPLFSAVAIRNLNFVQRLICKYFATYIEEFTIFLIVIILSVIMFFIFRNLVKKILDKVEVNAPREIDVEIKSEKNTEMLGFLLTYIVPFCITFDNGLYDLFAFFILFTLLLYAYIGTSLFCINPLLNYCFGYNIYEIEMHDKSNFMITTKKHRNTTKKIKIYMITDDLWKEK
jgi:hypothetical protein